MYLFGGFDLFAMELSKHQPIMIDQFKWLQYYMMTPVLRTKWKRDYREK